jgi:hypothetical protein
MVSASTSSWDAVAPVAGDVTGVCFVAISFDRRLDSAYADGIMPAVQDDCGFRVIRESARGRTKRPPGRRGARRARAYWPSPWAMRRFSSARTARQCRRDSASIARVSPEYAPYFHRARRLRLRPAAVLGPVLEAPCIRQRLWNVLLAKELLQPGCRTFIPVCCE